MINLLVALLGPLLKISAAPPPVPEGAEDVRVFRASDRYLSYRYLLSVVTALPAFLPALVIFGALSVASRRGEVPSWVALGVPAAYGLIALFTLALTLVTARLDFELHWYVTTDRSVRIRQGIWEQVEATLTYANVQNVRVIQGPLERFFGIASVVIETAGGGKRRDGREVPRGILRGLTDAAGLRDQIMERMRASRSAGLGDPDDPERGHHEPGALPAALLREIRDEARGLAEDLKRR